MAVASRVWDGVTWLAEWIWDKVKSFADGDMEWSLVDGCKGLE